MTRTCQPASAMLPPELAPMRVGLGIVSRQDRKVKTVTTYPKQMAMFPAFIRFCV